MMKKFFGLTALTMVLLGSAACADDPCDLVADRCDNCTGTAGLGCGITEAFGDSDACQELLDDPEFEEQCPE